MTLPRIISIGYEGRTVDDVVMELERHGATLLVDVRLTPLSRKPGLSKRALAERLAGAGIRYLHLRALGNPKDNRDPFRSGRVGEGRDRFATLLAAPEPQSALAEVAELTEQHVVAVLCFERDHASCHRQVVTEQVVHRLPAAAQVTYA